MEAGTFTVSCQFKIPTHLEDLSSLFYPLVYPDLRRNETEPSGGYVEMHVSHSSHETARNIETAIVLAKLGFKVRLLPVDNTPHVKNPDAYLIDEDIIIEFKHNSTPTASAIENEVRDAKKQADYILIHVQSVLSKDNLIKGLRRHIHRAINVNQVWLIFEEKLYRFTPTEVRNKVIEHKIQ